MLICPSGFHGDENLPAMEGVKRSQYDTLVRSVFHKGRFATRGARQSIRAQIPGSEMEERSSAYFAGNRGALRADLLLRLVPHPTLVIWGATDQVLSDVPGRSGRPTRFSRSAKW